MKPGDLVESLSSGGVFHTIYGLSKGDFGLVFKSYEKIQWVKVYLLKQKIIVIGSIGNWKFVS